MAKSAVIVLGPRDRYWANPPAERSWQRFWGTFERHPGSGLYLARGSDAPDIKNLANAFQRVPEQLQETCLDWRVTFSFAEYLTACGNWSTFYADFSQRSKELVSPHIEMGSRSLEPEYILAHLTHELSHLFWRTRTESQREEFRQFLKETCRRGTVEITEYVHSRYTEHIKASASRNTQQFGPLGRDAGLERWVEEAFCDTMAVLVSPNYPSFDRETTVDLATRRFVINSVFGLNLPPVKATL
ncbi:MAG: hypothetical protein JSS83_14695 [Cyanobacteria bacterium SZAS LIN-3]|nr:hypothetical protein [Cyanobacteria bacterium SZAS LIN-3]